MWSHRRTPVTRRAAAFCTDCRRRRELLLRGRGGKGKGGEGKWPTGKRGVKEKEAGWGSGSTYWVAWYDHVVNFKEPVKRPHCSGRQRLRNSVGYHLREAGLALQQRNIPISARSSKTNVELALISSQTEDGIALQFATQNYRAAWPSTGEIFNNRRSGDDQSTFTCRSDDL